MTVKLPTIDFKDAKTLLAADNNNVDYNDLSTLDNQTVSTAAVNLLKARQAQNPTNADQLQSEIDAINSGSMSAGQMQQILRSASSAELTNAVFTTAYGISESQFQQAKASGTLGSQYGLTPSEIASMASIMGASPTSLIGSLARSGSVDSMSGLGGGSSVAIGVGPISSSMSLGDFIGAIIAATESVLKCQLNTNKTDAAATNKRIKDVIKTAEDRINIMKKQAASQVKQLKNAISKIKRAKILQAIIAAVTYIATVIITIAINAACIAFTVATLGAGAPAIPAGVVVSTIICAIIIASTTAFFALQMKDIFASDGLNWMQRAANKKYGNDPNSQSADDAAKLREKKQHYETLLGSIQTVIDVITAVASLGTSSVGVAVKEAAQVAAQNIMRAIMNAIKAAIMRLIAQLQKVVKVIGLALVVGSGTINSMLSSGQLQDLMSKNSSMMQTYRSKFTHDAVEARYKEMRANPQYASLSDTQLRGYAQTEQTLINSGDKAGLAELYARREAYEQGTTTTLNLTNLHSGDALGALNSYQQSQLLDRASGAIHQRTLDSTTSYQSAIADYSQKNQGLIMGITIGAAIAGMAGGAALGGGGSSAKIEDEIAQSVSKTTTNLAKKTSEEIKDEIAQSVSKTTANLAKKTSEEIKDEIAQSVSKTTANLAKKTSEEIADEIAQSVSKTTTNLAKKTSEEIKDEMAQSLTLTEEKLVEKAGKELADLSEITDDAVRKSAARAARYQNRAAMVQAYTGIIQGLAGAAGSIYSAEMERQNIKNELKLNEDRRHFELMFALEDLATDVLNRLKEDIMDIEMRSLDSAKQFNAAIASIWQGLNASFNAAAAKKN